MVQVTRSEANILERPQITSWSATDESGSTALKGQGSDTPEVGGKPTCPKCDPTTCFVACERHRTCVASDKIKLETRRDTRTTCVASISMHFHDRYPWNADLSNACNRCRSYRCDIRYCHRIDFVLRSIPAYFCRATYARYRLLRWENAISLHERSYTWNYARSVSNAYKALRNVCRWLDHRYRSPGDNLFSECPRQFLRMRRERFDLD